jgi:putative CocE/NonD family hydrolase
MSLATRTATAATGLPPPQTQSIEVERDVRLPAPGGVALMTDLYWPQGHGRLPTILIRTPYGRRGGLGAPLALAARLFAERGYRVVVQSTRGTFGSGGEMDFSKEPADGRAAADWVVGQRWSNGEIGTYGPSYLSAVQWALASTRPPQLKAMAISIMAADARHTVYAGGSFALDTALTWAYQLAHQELTGVSGLAARARERRALQRAFDHLPLERADVAGIGREAAFYREWLRNEEPGHPYWGPLDFTGVADYLQVPISLLGGWYDYYLPHLLDDYRRVVTAGGEAELTIGAWRHLSPAGLVAGFREALRWFDIHLRGIGARRRSAPVRIQVVGSGWRDLAAWPPPSTGQRWHLHHGGGLSIAPPRDSAPDRYRYDPSNPTPAVGGASLSINSGPRDNRRLERRPDVLTYTSEPLEADLEVIGPVRAELVVSSSREHTDFFARLCDVEPGGRSVNVTDGLLRLRPGAPARAADGTACAVVAMWPTAHRFPRRHRLRLQVSSGSHPRYARNLGTGEPLATATRMVVADQSVYHDPRHPSAVVLPVASASETAMTQRA